MTEAPAKPTANLDAATVSEAGLADGAFPGTLQREFRVSFDEKVHDEIVKHAAETVDLELCGVLIGRILKDRDGPWLSITGSIRGEKANHQGTQVTFTHDTWDHIHEVKDKKFQKEQIVGWYHTHPGFGIFLSNMDMFIHEYFFTGATQVAHVIDPRSGEEGIFNWKAGKVERLPRFWIGSREKLCAIGAVGSRPAPARPAPAPASGGGAPSAPAKPEKDPDELDIVKPTLDLLSKMAPLALAMAFGFFFFHFFYSPVELERTRRALLHSEVSSLVTGAASAYGSFEELGGIEKRLAALSEAPGAVGIANELRSLQGEVAALKSASLVREDAILRSVHAREVAGLPIEEELRHLRAEVTLTRQVAIEAYLFGLKMRLASMVADKTLTPERRDAMRAAIEATLGADTEGQRAQIRDQFPELYPPPATKDGK